MLYLLGMYLLFPYLYDGIFISFTGHIQTTAINGGLWSENDLCASIARPQEETWSNVSCVVLCCTAIIPSLLIQNGAATETTKKRGIC